MDAQQSLVGLRERLLVRINVQEKARILAIKPPIVKYGEADVDKDRGRGRTGSEEAAAAEAAAAGGKGKKGGKKGMKGEGTLRGTAVAHPQLAVRYVNTYNINHIIPCIHTFIHFIAIYTRYTYICTTYTPHIRVPNTPLNLNTPYIHHIYT